MTMSFPALVDYSYARPDPDAIAGSGYGGALRYLGDDSRCLTVAERDRLLAAGLGIGLIWETSAHRPAAGWQAGVDDGHRANQEADGVGAPNTRIYYAVDFAPTTDELHGPIADYFRGALSVGGRPARAYGCASVMQHLCGDLGLFPDSWQCAAWSYPGTAPGTPINDGGYNLILSPYASMIQNIGYVLGDTCDHNSLINTSISWMWGKDGEDEDEMTDDDFNRIAVMVGGIVDNRILNFATPGVLLYDTECQWTIARDGRGCLVRNPVRTPGLSGLLRSAALVADQIQQANASPVDAINIDRLPQDQKDAFYGLAVAE